MSSLKEELFESIGILKNCELLSDIEYNDLQIKIENEDFYNWKK